MLDTLIDNLSDILGPEPESGILSSEPDFSLLGTDQDQNFLKNTDQTHREALKALEQVLPKPHEDYVEFNPLSEDKSKQFGLPEFTNPRELVTIINNYFKRMETPNEIGDKSRPTLSSLAMHLNIDRKKLLDLEQKPGFGPIISAAKTRIEAGLEYSLLDPRRTNIAGIALVLKNGFDWKEKQEVSGEMTFAVTRKMFSDPSLQPVEELPEVTLEHNPTDNA